MMKATILVIDDELSIRELCARVLSQAGYAVNSAGGGEEAMAMLSRTRYDLILCDLKMPGELSGHELVAALRREWPAVSVIVMTGYPSVETAVSTVKQGAFEYLTKPFEIETLLGVVLQCLQTRHLSKELDRERLLREELQAAYAQLQESDRQKEAFLARFNHEVRTPIMFIFHHLAQMEASSSQNPSAHLAQIKDLRKGIDRIWNLMDNLLLLSDLKNESLQADYSRVNLRTLLHTVALHLKSQVDAKQLEVEFVVGDEPWILEGDGVLLQTALKHLFLNAIHFNKRGGKIRIEMKDSLDHIAIRFSDTGIGIAQDKLKTIFQSFYQVAQHMTREVGGLGIGLTIVRRIIEAHGGEINITSEENEGSTFEILLPKSGRASRLAIPSGDVTRLQWAA